MCAQRSRFRSQGCPHQDRKDMARRSERLFINASSELDQRTGGDTSSLLCDRFTIADITALVGIDIGGRLADIKIAPKFAHLSRWHETVSIKSVQAPESEGRAQAVGTTRPL